MSQKKNKKHTPPPTLQAKSKNPGKLRGSNETKRFNPLARNILYTDLIILALAQIMYSNGWISDAVSGIATSLGIVLLIMAMYIQFSPKSDKPKSPRL